MKLQVLFHFLFGRLGVVCWLLLILRACEGAERLFGRIPSLRRNQFGNADEVVSDQIEHEVGGDAKDAAMLGLAHRAVLLAPAEDAFDHRAARLRHAIALVPRGACVDGAFPPPAGLGWAIVLRHMRCDAVSYTHLTLPTTPYV